MSLDLGNPSCGHTLREQNAIAAELHDMFFIRRFLKGFFPKCACYVMFQNGFYSKPLSAEELRAGVRR